MGCWSIRKVGMMFLNVNWASLASTLYKAPPLLNSEDDLGDTYNALVVQLAFLWRKQPGFIFQNILPNEWLSEWLTWSALSAALTSGLSQRVFFCQGVLGLTTTLALLLSEKMRRQQSWVRPWTSEGGGKPEGVPRSYCWHVFPLVGAESSVMALCQMAVALRCSW